MRLIVRTLVTPPAQRELVKGAAAADPATIQRMGSTVVGARISCGSRAWDMALKGSVLVMSTEDGLPMPLHVVVRGLPDALATAEAIEAALAEGKAPPRGVFRLRGDLPMDPMAKAQPGMVLAPSKSNPAVKRWQRIGSAHGTSFTAPLKGRDVTFTVGPSAHPGHVQLLRSDYGNESGPHIPAESVEHFHDDLNGVLRASPTSGNPHVDAVLSGHGERVGKGHDGIVYTTGDHAVKVSTTVPFHPDNSFHRTPAGAAAHLAAETAAHERFADLPAIPKTTGVDHEGRHYLVKPKLTFGEKYTAEELKPVFDTVRGMHARGFVVGDDVQVGRASDGKVYLSDLGQVRPIEHRSHLDNDERDDLEKLGRLYREHGHQMPLDTGAAELAYRDSLKAIGLWRGAAKKKPTPENRARLDQWVQRAGVVDKLMALQDLHRAAGNQEALDALDREYDELLGDIHGEPDELAKAVALDPPPTANRLDHPIAGTLRVHGLVIHVENPAGSMRRGVDADGKPWATKMHDHYGEILHAPGDDGDPLDVFVGPDPAGATRVYVIATKTPGTPTYDECKVMLGYPSRNEAVAAFRRHYGRPGFYMDAATWELPDFLAAVHNHGTDWMSPPSRANVDLTKGATMKLTIDRARLTELLKAGGAAPGPLALFGGGGAAHGTLVPKKVSVPAHTRKDGTHVAQHTTTVYVHPDEPVAHHEAPVQAADDTSRVTSRAAIGLTRPQIAEAMQAHAGHAPTLAVLQAELDRRAAKGRGDAPPRLPAPAAAPAGAALSANDARRLRYSEIVDRADAAKAAGDTATLDLLRAELERRGKPLPPSLALPPVPIDLDAVLETAARDTAKPLEPSDAMPTTTDEFAVAGDVMAIAEVGDATDKLGDASDDLEEAVAEAAHALEQGNLDEAHLIAVDHAIGAAETAAREHAEAAPEAAVSTQDAVREAREAREALASGDKAVAADLPKPDEVRERRAAVAATAKVLDLDADRDVGEVIAGSRKQKAAIRSLTELRDAEAAGVDALTIDRAMVKAKMFDPPDAAALREAGVPLEVVHARRALHALIAGKPAIPKGAKPTPTVLAMAREGYATMAEWWPKQVDACNTLHDVELLMLRTGAMGLVGHELSEALTAEEVLERIGVTPAEAMNKPLGMGNEQRVSYLRGKNGVEYRVAGSQLQRAGYGIGFGYTQYHPEASQGRQYHLSTPITPAMRLRYGGMVVGAGDRFIAVCQTGSKHRELLREADRVGKSGDWTAVGLDITKDEAEGKKAKAKSARAELAGFVHGHRGEGYVREGGREVGTVSTEQFNAAFGLRATQFGKRGWVDDEAAEHHVTRAHAAFTDLADVLGIDPKHVSQGGLLGMAFGARGSGQFGAHYEAGDLVINLTQTRGGGALAHEWGHFLDHALSGAIVPTTTTTDDGVVTRNAEKWVAQVNDRGGVSYRAHFASEGEPGGLHPEAITAIQEVMGAIQDKGPARLRADVARKAYFGMSRNTRPDEVARLRREYNEANAAAEAEEAAKPKRPARRRNGDTLSFYESASVLGDYWERPREMFARAFEAYVEDKLASRGQRNTYLVAGTTKPPSHEMEVKEGKGVLARTTKVIVSAYPHGEERARINAAFDRMFDALRRSGDLVKALDAAEAIRRALPRCVVKVRR